MVDLSQCVSMTMRLNPSGQTVVNNREGTVFDAADQRLFLRIKAVKSIELSIGADIHTGQTYDIGQGGLCFIVSNPVDLGPAIVRIANSNFVFQGKILASHRSGVSETVYFHFQFDKPVDMATLAVALGI